LLLILILQGLVSGDTWLGFMYHHAGDLDKSMKHYTIAACKSEPFACEKLVTHYSQNIDLNSMENEKNFVDLMKNETINLKSRLLNTVKFAYLGLHNDVKVIEPMKKKLTIYLPFAISALWINMKQFLLIDDNPLSDETKIIFFMMLFECKSVYYGIDNHMSIDSI
jgi:hypothetical protein